MIRKSIFILVLSFLYIQIAMPQTSSKRIRHTVVFKLKHPAGSAEEKAFLDAIKKLDNIPGVENLELLKQISKKNTYDFGLSMEFANQEAYDGYNNHPDHVAFVQNIWMKEVEDFLEIDFALE
jgi:hypothetical protein